MRLACRVLCTAAAASGRSVGRIEGRQKAAGPPPAGVQAPGPQTSSQGAGPAD